jgi:tetratricopeptide (TPR) repeat protein
MREGGAVSTPSNHEVSPLRQGLAYWWYIWGQSLAYWGVRTAEHALFRAGISAYGQAIRAWPEFALAHYRRGVIRGRELSQYQEALVDLGRAIALEPDWPDPYLHRGLFQRFQGDLQGALEDLQMYLSLGGEMYWRLEAERQIAQIRTEIEEFKQ